MTLPSAIRPSRAAAPAGAWQVEVRRDEGALIELAGELRDLYERSPEATPFQSHEWLSAWWGWYGVRGRLRLVLVRYRGRLVAAAPLMTAGRWGFPVLVPIADVLYLLAEDKYVVVHHTKGQVLIEDALKALEEEFGDRFVRIHRNCLVARERITGLARTADGRIFAQITGSADQLEVSRRNLPSPRKLARNL